MEGACGSSLPKHPLLLVRLLSSWDPPTRSKHYAAWGPTGKLKAELNQCLLSASNPRIGQLVTFSFTSFWLLLKKTQNTGGMFVNGKNLSVRTQHSQMRVHPLKILISAISLNEWLELTQKLALTKAQLPWAGQVGGVVAVSQLDSKLLQQSVGE